MRRTACRTGKKTNTFHVAVRASAHVPRIAMAAMKATERATIKYVIMSLIFIKTSFMS